MFTTVVSFTAKLVVSSLKAIGPVSHVYNYLMPQYRNMASRGINYNSKHLKKGDPLPPFNGKLRVYNMRYCPYAQRTILALNAKQIDYEIVNIDLYEKPEWLTSKSAFGKVPALEIKEGLTIYESLITVEYLDDIYPQRPLLSKDPVQKAFDKIIVEAANSIAGLFIKIVKKPEAITDNDYVAYQNTLDFLQKQLQARGSKFFGGSEPGYVDYMIWPFFERMIPFSKDNDRIKLDGQNNKLLVEYLANMKKDPVVSDYLIPDDILFKFTAAYKTGSRPNYELMAEN